MKILRRLVILVIICAVLIYIGGTYFLNAKAKDLLALKLSKATGRSVEIGQLSYVFPLNVNIDGMTIDGVSPGKSIRLFMDFANLSRDHIQFSRLIITEPSIPLRRTKDGQIIVETSAKTARKNVGTSRASILSLGIAPAYADTLNEVTSPAGESSAVKLTIAELVIIDGRLDFTDEKFKNLEKIFKSDTIQLNHVNAVIENIVFPAQPVNSRFKIKAVFGNEGTPFTGSQLEGEGWVNVLARDMDAQLRLVKPDGVVGFKADFVAKSNDMNVHGDISIAEVVGGLAGQKEEGAKQVQDMVFGALSSMGVNVGAQFSFDTKMDDFQMTNISFSGKVITQ